MIEVPKEVVSSYPQPGGRSDTYSPFRTYANSIRRREFDSPVTVYDLKDLWDIQNGLCALSGLPMSLPKNTRGQGAAMPNTASLDRIDNRRGYVKENLRWVVYMANICRGPFTDNDLIKFAEAVVKYNGT